MLHHFLYIKQEFKYVVSVLIFHVPAFVCVFFVFRSISPSQEMCVLSKNPQVKDCLWKGCEKLVNWACLFRIFIWLMIKKEYRRPPNRSNILSWLPILSFSSSGNKFCPRNRNLLMAMLSYFSLYFSIYKPRGLNKAWFSG